MFWLGTLKVSKLPDVPLHEFLSLCPVHRLIDLISYQKQKSGV